MMTNLFSMFDPSSSFLSLNWIMFITPMMIFPLIFLFKSKMTSNIIFIKNLIDKELSSMMGNNKKKSSLSIMSSIFFFLMMINMISLFPFNFTISSQISFSFPAAISMWMSFMILGWIKNTKSMMAHLLPLGTPPILMPIMVIIEIISQIIRPITLSVRLTANMVAGHLLMSLLGSFSLNSLIIFSISSPLLMMLSFLELCVSAIQAFVFMTLLTLYSTEIN